jgi:ribA/ribD-fused uncharacterized protein
MREEFSPKVIDCFKNKYSFLSNFYPCEVLYDGIKYRSAEAAFQSAKTTNMDKRMSFVNMLPNQAKKEGRKLSLREDWEEVKYNIMLEIVRNKFKWNKNLKEKLIATENAELIEGNWWGDTVWGVCNGIGSNYLGKILMQVREEIQ